MYRLWTAALLPGLACSQGTASAFTPPPLALGISDERGLGGPCDERLADGRRYREMDHPLVPGQRLGVSISSPDFDPVLHVFNRSDPGKPLAVVNGAAGRGVSGLVFTAPEQGEYVFRILGAAEARGAYRLELNYAGRIEEEAPGARPAPAAPAPCSKPAAGSAR